MKFEIVNRKQLTADIFSVEVLAPNVARHALPGHFVIVIAKQGGERIPLTIADYDRKKGTILLVVQIVGNTTRLMSTLQQGECLASMVGPLGRPSDLTEMTVEQLRQMHILFVAGGVGAAPVLPQVKYLHNLGIAVDVIVGSKSKQHLILKEEMKNYAARLVVTTDDGSYGEKGLVTEALTRLVKEEGNHYDRVVAIGPMVMMKFVSQLTKELGIPTIVSLNSLMVDGTGMCGACRVSVGNKTRFTCVDGPEFDGHAVDYDEALVRQNAYKFIQGQQQAERQEAKEHHQCFVGGTHNDTPALDRFHRVPITEQPADVRNKNFEEVCLGYTLEEAMLEASRCLQCKKPACVTGCPVSISIPNFIKQVAVGNIPEAAAEIAKASCLPAVCGRVCPQETQCEAQCVLAKKSDAVSIGKLERFVADYMRQHHTPPFEEVKEKTGKKVAILGSGPAGLSAAGDLIKAGYDVTIYEALHESGGVLTYGIPEFRLPKSIVAYEIEQLLKQGVHLETDTVIGKTLTIEDLFEHEHFSAVFIATGAGLPKFMNIAGENLNGVYSANEFLTRNNLMKSYLPEAETPNFVGKHTVVVGGGNVAMDAA
ncbi:MAG: sulfide/dihydroorotate dehydrogenase-like FAD/NAD-binding protein, partial [Bacteroidales bacterium]|nr:sulfide/dihydroorotate dehydrogenase-like FAD/NAD-binding protein [Bacteroidales bacterium]